MGVRRSAGDGLQVGPSGWHESPRAVWEDQDEPERAVASHPAQNRQTLTFKWMTAPNNCDGRRKAIEVGSVALVRSAASIGRGSGNSYGTGSTTADSSDS
jgi:hypothetical protein